MRKKRSQYLRQLVGVRCCGIFNQEITSDLGAKEIIIITIIIIMLKGLQMNDGKHKILYRRINNLIYKQKMWTGNTEMKFQLLKIDNEK